MMSECFEPERRRDRLSLRVKKDKEIANETVGSENAQQDSHAFLKTSATVGKVAHKRHNNPESFSSARVSRSSSVIPFSSTLWDSWIPLPDPVWPGSLITASAAEKDPITFDHDHVWQPLPMPCKHCFKMKKHPGSKRHCLQEKVKQTSETDLRETLSDREMLSSQNSAAKSCMPAASNSLTISSLVTGRKENNFSITSIPSTAATGNAPEKVLSSANMISVHNSPASGCTYSNHNVTRKSELNSNVYCASVTCFSQTPPIPEYTCIGKHQIKKHKSELNSCTSDGGRSDDETDSTTPAAVGTGEHRRKLPTKPLFRKPTTIANGSAVFQPAFPAVKYVATSSLGDVTADTRQKLTAKSNLDLESCPLCGLPFQALFDAEQRNAHVSACASIADDEALW